MALLIIGLKEERISVVYLWDLKPAKKQVTPGWISICICLFEL